MFGLMRKKTHADLLHEARNHEHAAHRDWAEMFRERNDERDSRFEMQQRLEAVLDLLDGHKGTTISVRRVENAIGELPDRKSA